MSGESRNTGTEEHVSGVIPSIVRSFLTGKQSVLLLIFALCLGAAAIQLTPREEEPQIVVPMADILVQVPGASAEEVEKLVATPLERLLWQIDGVEYVYSTSRRDACAATVRFFVGEDREESLVKLHNRIMMNTDLVPSIVAGWSVKPVEIDDVPIVSVTLFSDRYDSHALRRIGEEVFHRLAEIEDLSRVTITGGEPREILVSLLPERMQGLGVSPQDVADALRGADVSVTAGSLDDTGRSLSVTSDSFLHSAAEVAALVVGVYDDRPVYLRDIADVNDGPAEATTYTRIGFSERHLSENSDPFALSGPSEGGRNTDSSVSSAHSYPAVTLALSKKKGTNAVFVAEAVLERMNELKRTVIPDGVEMRVTRNYGETAQAKVNDLLSSLFFAIVTVVALLAFTLGRREALIVAVAVPVSFALALFVNWVFGYTINRVTLFALILSLGLVVDDPITNVDNIQRHIFGKKRGPLEATLYAVKEVLPPVLLSTLAIIISFTPMFFITGMMGPYMAPMAANVPLTVTFSTVCALTIVPWLAYNLLKGQVADPAVPVNGDDPKENRPVSGGTGDTGDAAVPAWISRGYAAVITPFLDSPGRRRVLAFAIFALLLASCSLAVLRQVPLKMLPFDNKNEFQIVLDMPEGTSLENTDAAVRRFERFLRTVPEVTDFTTYAGTSSPMDFNGMVRHYYMRTGSHQADIRVNLADKLRRSSQSHSIVLRLRSDLERIAEDAGARLKIVEVPPGPPVIATVTAEVYGPPDAEYGDIIAAARELQGLMASEPGVSDLDGSWIYPHERLDFVVDKEKAALHGVVTADITETLSASVGGTAPATVHESDERQPLPVRIRLPRDRRSSPAALEQVPVKTASGDMIALGELGGFRRVAEDQPVYHKNLRRVAYVYAEMAGRAPGEAIIDLQSRLRETPLPGSMRAEWAGEGEWEITIRVFRDLGLAFGAALVGIYILLVIQTGSWALPGLIMTAIPLTLLGIMPGFWLLNLLFADSVGGYPDPIFFTATSMIGMIALGGIVIRNSLVLIEFVQEAVRNGAPLRDAVLQSGAIRLRPIVLTAATTALGAWPITLDPIFSGLAWALIFGLVASTLFTLVVIPVAYYALMQKAPAHESD